MVYVRLDQDWTDGNGNQHEAGTMVDVDAGTLAQLQASGVVSDGDGQDGTESGGWVGPSDDPDSGGWVGPSNDPDSGGWVGPSGGTTSSGAGSGSGT